MTVAVTITFLVLMFLGMPVAFAVGVATMSFFALSDTIPTSIGIQRIVSATQSFPLLAVPLFVLAGNLMNVSGITERLIHLATTLAGWMRGGLAQVAILLSCLMGGVSGSAVAEAAMEARILGPAMLKQGYSKGFTCGSVAVGALITATIPPSIGLILYGFLGNVSIGKLFIGGIVPGLLMTAFLMTTAYLISVKRGYKPALKERPSLRQIARDTNSCKWALLFPVFLLVGIRYGVFTPSEAGAFAVAYAVAIGAFVYRELTWAKTLDALHRSASDVGMIMLIIMFSSMAGYMITLDRVPQSATEVLAAVTRDPTLLMFILVGFLLALGMFLESTVIVLLLTPILVPVVTAVGIDPVHFGLVMMTCVTFGGMTPPVGVAMYAVCGILNCSMDEYTRGAYPFMVAIVALVAIMILWPDLVMFLPNALM
ncbi:MAG: TRAP transporter large permease [Alphaproteobacteria bacterium]|nr:TRAP transporter large permease [Alphaproteobacteria bacterium]